MENLIKKLQKEAGLTKEQAISAVNVFKDYMDKEGVKVDWETFFKGKYNEYLNQGKSYWQNIKDKVENKTDDIVSDAKQKVMDASKKVYNTLSDDEKLK